MDLSKSAINKKYDQLMSQLKSGDLSQKQFKTAADRLYKLYHSDANKAQRAKDAKPVARKSTKSTPSTQQAKKPAPKKNVRGSGVEKTGKKIDLGKTLKNLSDNFKLTRKAGEVFTVGNMRYVSDGKGGIRSSQRIR